MIFAQKSSLKNFEHVSREGSFIDIKQTLFTPAEKKKIPFDYESEERKIILEKKYRVRMSRERIHSRNLKRKISLKAMSHHHLFIVWLF